MLKKKHAKKETNTSLDKKKILSGLWVMSQRAYPVGVYMVLFFECVKQIGCTAGV